MVSLRDKNASSPKANLYESTDSSSEVCALCRFKNSVMVCALFAGSFGLIFKTLKHQSDLILLFKSQKSVLIPSLVELFRGSSTQRFTMLVARVNIDPISTKAKETLMSNRSIIIMVLVLIGATAYLLLKGDGNVDMSGEKHGAEATHVEEAKNCLLYTSDAADD